MKTVLLSKKSLSELNSAYDAIDSNIKELEPRLKEIRQERNRIRSLLSLQRKQRRKLKAEIENRGGICYEQ